MFKLKLWRSTSNTAEPIISDSSSSDGSDFQFDGFENNKVETKYVDYLSDEDLKELNQILRWNCFTADSRGRRFGRRAWSGKRETPQIIPDIRIVQMNNEFNLADKHLLEIGCFEGIHTIGLSRYAAKVTAIDSRIENVVKTIVRCAMFGCHPTVFKCDLENPSDVLRLPEVDLLHHVGVLYHLVDPVTHILDLGRYVKHGIMLDTHVARPGEATLSYTVGDRSFKYRKLNEGGKAEVFSGMGSHAKWLTLKSLISLLEEAGFTNTRVLEERDERNGARVLILGKRGTP